MSIKIYGTIIYNGFIGFFYNFKLMYKIDKN